jgi:hypothetical protein
MVRKKHEVAAERPETTNGWDVVMRAMLWFARKGWRVIRIGLD